MLSSSALLDRPLPSIQGRQKATQKSVAAAAAAYREQISRAVEHTLLRRNGRRYAKRLGGVLDAWGPCQVSTQHPSSFAAAVPRAPSKADQQGNTSAADPPSAAPAGHSSFLTSVTCLGGGSTPLPKPPASIDVPSTYQRLGPGAFVDSSLEGSLLHERKRARQQRLRRFFSQKRALRDAGDDAGADEPSAPAPPAHIPSPPRTSQRRARRLPSTGATAASPAHAAAPEPAAPHPWRELMHLGSSNFNDAPLDTFMSSLSLRCEVPLPTTTPGWAPSIVGDPPPPCVVHLADMEATRFRVEVPSSLYASPIQPLLKGVVTDGADRWDALHDGSLFFLTPLLDEEEETPAPSDLGAAITAALRSTPFLGLLASSVQRPLSGEGVRIHQTAVGSLPRPDSSPAATQERAGLGAGSDEATAPPAGDDLDSTVARMRTRTMAGAAVQHRSHVESWRLYSTAVALYLCLAQAGVCDVDSLPFLSVSLLPLHQLLSGCDVRMELMGTCNPAKVWRLLKRAESREECPVAVTLPMKRKGTLRALPSAKGDLPSIATQPFTDAEVFQLFYLQLVFRAFYDVRFPDMTWHTTGRAATDGVCGLRSDKLGSTYYERTTLAFEHPSSPDAWLLFPARSRVLTIMDLEHAVIPLYASSYDLQRSAAAPLFGSTPDVPCQTSFGYQVVQWAAEQEVHSPRAAYKALGDLFSLFSPRYGGTRASVWCAAMPPKVFRCRSRIVSEAMCDYCGRLSRFFVPEESRIGELDSPKNRHALAQHDAPFLLSSSRQLSRKSSIVASSPPKPALPSLWPSQDVHEDVAAHGTVGERRGEEEEEAIGKETQPAVEALERSVVAGAGASFSVLELPDGVAPSTLHTPSAAGSSHLLHKSGALDASGTLKASQAEVGGAEEVSDTALAMAVGATSPFTKQESLVTRWRHYAHEGVISIFDGVTTGIELHGFLGRGGSGLVYRGHYGKRRLPVAVKVFVIPDRMEHESYVRESLTDVAFFVLMNQLDDFGICSTCRAHDFIVSATPPRGLPAEDADTARRHRDPETTRLCYLVTDLMDGTLGRFLAEDEDDFDPCYDTLVNSPLRDGELFHFLFVQLAIKAMFDWKIFDLMLHGQLRGDNIGFRYVDIPAPRRKELEADPKALSEALLARNYYKGVIVAFQGTADEPTRYLRFTSDLEEGDPALGPLRLIHFIDMGQGIQPNVTELTRNHFIGETVVDSCVQDDGFGRYWPLDELYCRYVDVKGSLADQVVSWGSGVRVNSQSDAVQAMAQLMELYYPVYGIEEPTKEERMSHMLFTWSPHVVGELKKAYVYRPDAAS